MNIREITLDVSKEYACECVTLGQHDNQGTTIKATIYDNGALLDDSGLTARFCMRLPDRSNYFSDDAGALVDGVITYTVDESGACAVAGHTDDCYFEIMAAGDVVSSTGRFAVDVLRAVEDGAQLTPGWQNEITQAIDTMEEVTADAVTRANNAAASCEGIIANAVNSAVENLCSFYDGGRLGYISNNSGGFSMPTSIDVNTSTSGYIPIDDAQKYIIQMWNDDLSHDLWCTYGFYDANKEFISPRTVVTVGRVAHWSSGEITPPDGAAYMRVSARIYDGVRVKVERGEVPTGWIPNAIDAQQFAAFGNVHPLAAGSWADWWSATTPDYLTQLDDGFFRFYMDRSEQTSVSAWFGFNAKISSLVTLDEGINHLYTCLYEIRRNESTTPSGNIQFDECTSNSNSQLVSGSTYANLADLDAWGAGKRLQLIHTPAQLEGLNINRFMTFSLRVPAGAVLDFEVRFSVYPGIYTGDYVLYKPTLADITRISNAQS